MSNFKKVKIKKNGLNYIEVFKKIKKNYGSLDIIFLH